MRIFLAGASGVIGARLVPLLVQDGHQVVGMTRSRLYGPGAYRETSRLVPSPRIHVDEAAQRTVDLLDARSGVVVVAEDG